MLGHISPHHFLVAWLLEPPSLHSYGVKSRILGVQSHRSQFCAFRATISSQLGCLEPLSLNISGIQSHCLFTVMVFGAVFLAHIPSIQSYQYLVRHSKSPSLHSYGVQRFILGIQSHRSQFSVQSRRSQFSCSKQLFTVWCLEPSFTVWHVEPLVNLAFKATIFFQFNIHSHWSTWHLEPPYFFSSMYKATFLAFKAIRFQFNIQSHHLLQFGIQSYHIFILTFKVVSLVRHSESLVSLAFKATIFLQFSVQSHIYNIQSCHFLLVRCSKAYSQHLESLFSFSSTFRVVFFSLGVQSHLFFNLAFRVVFFQFGIQRHCSVQVFRATIFRLGV